MCKCQNCKFKNECGYYNECIKPVQNIVDNYSNDIQFGGEYDEYLSQLSNVLNKFTCEEFQRN
jgi:hypothetical protein